MTQHEQSNHTSVPGATLAWGVWGLAAALYLIGFFQRVAPAVMTDELMREFTIGAAALGNLSALYFYSYVAMQVPTGLLADAWGPRRLLTAGAAVAAIGTLLFASADSLFLAGMGRFLIGGSVAVAFVGMLKLASHWFAPNQFSLASGMALFVGIVGAVFAGVPLRLMVTEFGWRPVMMGAAVVTALVAVAIWLLVRDDPQERGYSSHAHPEAQQRQRGGEVWRGLIAVLRIRNVQLLFLVPGGIVGSILTFAGLWGVPFLTTHYGMATTEAAAACSTLLVAWAVGGPIFGGLSDRFARRKPFYAFGCIGLVALWAVIIFVPALPRTLLWGVLIATGFLSGSMIVGFAYAKESVTPALGGTVSGLYNMGVMLGPMLMQPVAGWVLDMFWDGTISEGTRSYGIAAYRAGFTPMFCWLIIAVVAILLTKETHARQQ
jgi:sugar phosphate permease